MEIQEIITLPVGQLQANCYLYVDKFSKETIIIDPGDDADFIERNISDRQLKPRLILATHGHFDHIMAVLELKLAYKIPFKASAKDKFLVNNMSKSAEHFIGIDTGPPPSIDASLKEAEIIKIGRSLLTVIGTPGHTPGSVCLYDKISNSLFTGDTLFADSSIGRTDFSYSSHENLRASLKKIFNLPGKTKIFPGHGRPSTLEEEKNFHF